MPGHCRRSILKRFRAALDEIYGDRIERVVLFGSRARRDAGADSDYDVAVFLRDLKEGDLGAVKGRGVSATALRSSEPRCGMSSMRS